ncbi:MAG TPA: CHAT domain-containing protein [Pyrinomonadaceae bacterium]
MSGRDEHETIRKYLLGQLTGPQAEQFEQRFFTDDELFEELQAGEEELIDDFLTDDLSQADLAMFHQNFLVGPERQRQLRLGKAWREYARVNSRQAGFTPRPVPGWRKLFAAYSFRVAAFAAVLVVAAIGVWRLFLVESEVDKALLALNSAYRQQRPLESRITRFDYAPFVTTRGPGSAITDQNELNRAELALLEALRKNPTPATRHALGNVYLAKKEFDRAIALFDEALKSDPNNARVYADRGAAWLEKGKSNLDRGKDSPGDEAGQGVEEVGRSLVNLTKALELESGLLEAQFNKALAEQYIHLYDQAEQDWNDYLRRDSNSAWAEEARRHLELLRQRRDKTGRTNDELIRAFLEAYEKRDDDAAWSALRVSRARTGNVIVETLLNDFLKLSNGGAREPAEQKLKAIQYAGLVEEKKVSDRYTSELGTGYAGATSVQLQIRTRARALMQTAIESYNKAEWTTAIDGFNKCRELFRESNDSVEFLFAEAFVGYSYLRIPDPQKALDIFDRLSKIFEARNYRSMYAQSVLALADAMNGRNEFSKMLDRTAESQVISEQVEDYANMVRCLQAQTSVQLIFGDYRKSLTAASRGMNIASTLPPDAKLTWPLYHETASNFYFLGLPTVALEFEKVAVKVALGARMPFQASRAFDRLALIQQRIGNVPEARNNSEQARAQGLTIIDERARTNVLAHSAMNYGRLHRHAGEFQTAIASFDEALGLYEKLNLDIYQYQARKGKLLSLIALHENDAAEAELRTVLFWFEKNREKISEESYRNKFFDTDQDTYEIAVDFYQTRKGDAATALNYSEAYRARSLWELINTTAQMTGDGRNPQIKLAASTTPLTLEQIQTQLSLDTQVLEYAVLDDKVLMWVVTKDSLRSGKTEIKRSDLDAMIGEYLAILSQPNPSLEEARRRGRDLYVKLVQPVEGFLDRNLLVAIIPDDKLSFLPFASLVSPATGKYLIEDYTIQTSPSAGIFVAAAQRQNDLNKPERLLVVGNPTFNRQQFQELPDLPAATREANEVANIYGATPLTGIEATSARVKKDLVNADVVHMATHALADDRSPLMSKLVLSSGGPTDAAHHASKGFIQAFEIYGMKLPRTQLVVLSACQTGIERAYRGEGAIGLARPFIAAGVPVVVASLWPVESESTSDLMISFHKHRKQKNISAVKALRLAQLEILHNQQPSSPKNYGWAAFTVIGGYAGS